MTKGNGIIQIFEDAAERGGQLDVDASGGVLDLAASNANVPGVGQRDTTSAASIRGRFAASAREPQAVLYSMHKAEAMGHQHPGALRKEPARHTIYVPSEDITLTIHPGMSFTDRSQVESIAQIQAHTISRTRRTIPRQSLTAAPKRLPLQVAARKPQENGASYLGLPGRPTGKENVPPGGLCAGRKDKIPMEDNASDTAYQQRISSPSTSIGSIARPVRSSPVPIYISSTQAKYSTQKTLKRSRVRSDSSLAEKHSLPYLPEKLLHSVVKLPAVKKTQYALLEEAIPHPRMFEDAWLNNQETAILELINSLFETAHPRKTQSTLDIRILRSDLIQLCQQPSMLFLYKRLNASLNYGALRPSQDSMVENCRLIHKVAIRRRFVDLWVKTYNVKLLQCCAEVIVGRKAGCRRKSSPRSKGSGVGDLEVFIETCILRNEDASKPAQSQSDSSCWSWQCTVQRSLMLIYLLDKAKETSIIPINLFRTDSLHKSSLAVLQELTALMLPSGGNPTRALNQLDYQLLHVQRPLSEYTYTIQNLAVGLRDGVPLTHLVELLLCPSSQSSHQRNVTTLTVPSRETLSFHTKDKHIGRLSQHLKFPCQGRACKLYNVQIALSALMGVKGVTSIAESICSKDVVDGHQEKTMIMLWALVGTLGLKTLVDRNDLEYEVRRLESMYDGPRNAEQSSDWKPSPSQRIEQLLRIWVTAVAHRHNLVIGNLTTSLADGRVFGCLVNEYHHYLVPESKLDTDATLEMQSRM